MFPPFSAIFGTPSTLLPWYRCSSPCKLSWSEPRWTLLSVELRSLSCFNMPSLSKALPFLHHAFFPGLVLRFPFGLSRVSFLQCPHFPSSFLQFPWLYHLQSNGSSQLSTIFQPSFLANCLGPNTNERCAPLSFGFGVLLICLICLSFSILCLSSIMPFFLALCYVFLRVFPEFPSYNCLLFPKVSSSFPPVQWFLHNFPPFSSISPSFSRCFFIFLRSPEFFHNFPSVFSGPRENRAPPSPYCLVVHASRRNQKSRPNHHLISRFLAYWAKSSPHTPYTHFVRENNFA